jgi:nucleotide-binding universal stress UspA family protein
MFSHVIVGVDERTVGRDPVTLAKNLLCPGGNLTLARVCKADPYGYHGFGGRAAAEELDRATRLLETAREQSDIEADLRCVRSASVGRGLHELAEELGADLLVLGSSSRGLLGRVLLGDDTRAAINGAPCAVAIATTGYGEQRAVILEVGVGYDGSPESERALRIARAIAARHEAKLSACQVVSVPLPGLGAGPLPTSDVIDPLVRDAHDRIAGLGGVEPHAVYGPAPLELAMFSRSLDLLVVGSRGYGPVGRLMHGSTSGELARIAQCPLLILPRAARRDDRRAPDRATHETPAAGAASR